MFGFDYIISRNHEFHILQTKAKCAIEETKQNYPIRRYDYLNPRNDKCADSKMGINIKLMNCVSSFG